MAASDGDGRGRTRAKVAGAARRLGRGSAMQRRDQSNSHHLRISGGTGVGQCDVWACADAALFRPERWLEAQGERLERVEGAVGTVFGDGRHRCLGKTIAGIELDRVI